MVMVLQVNEKELSYKFFPALSITHFYSGRFCVKLIENDKIKIKINTVPVAILELYF